ncbi:MAG: TIM barrel protein [Candidatus Omnitrophota bacterium]
MVNLGLKLWSDNDEYMPHAEELYREGYYDFIELYAVPGTSKEYLDRWKSLGVKFVIHAPHSFHGFNLADSGRAGRNKVLFEEARRFADGLAAEHIVVHPGVLGTEDAVFEQLKVFGDSRVLLENMPYRALDKGICAGHDPERVRDLVSSCHIGFCLDIAHASNYAINFGWDYCDVLEEFMCIEPKLIHMCGIDISSETDSHLHLKDSQVSMDEIGAIIRGSGVKRCTLETPKDSRINLDDFKEEISTARKILGGS